MICEEVRAAYATDGWDLWTDGRSFYAGREGALLRAAEPVDVLRMANEVTAMESE